MNIIGIMEEDTDADAIAALLASSVVKDDQNMIIVHIMLDPVYIESLELCVNSNPIYSPGQRYIELRTKERDSPSTD